MKFLKTLIALAIISIVVQGAMAANTNVINNKVSSTGVGTIEYAMNYAGTPTAPVTGPTTTTSSIVPGQSVTASFTGISVTKADEIDSALISLSDGGDLAYVAAQIGNGATVHNTASVTNYAMYGYVTPNFAYAGQYADKITGNLIYMQSEAFNNFVGGAAALPALATLPLAMGSYITALAVPATGRSEGDTTIYGGKSPFSNTATDGGSFSLTKGYQFAQAGGSADTSLFPTTNGIWAQAVIDKDAALGIVAVGASDKAYMWNNASYVGPSGEYLKSPLDDQHGTFLQVEGSGSAGATLTTNSQSMAYADTELLYTNVDGKTTMKFGATPQTKYASSSDTVGIFGPNHRTSSVGQLITSSPDTFVYSLVNAANPNGVSQAVFY